MPQEWSKKPTLKSSFADLKVGLGAILSGNAPVNSSGSSGPTAAQQAFFASASSNQSDDGPGYARRPAGPTPDQLIAQQVAAERAAKRAAKKRMGKARRKKYEAAQTMVKKMKLLFTDQGSST
jgi:hypothetical protein